MALVDVLIPTYRRKTGLAVVLTSLLGQTFTDFDVIISDQTEDDAAYLDSIEIQTLVRALRWHGILERALQQIGNAKGRAQCQGPTNLLFMSACYRPRKASRVYSTRAVDTNG